MKPVRFVVVALMCSIALVSCKNWNKGKASSGDMNAQDVENVCDNGVQDGGEYSMKVVVKDGNCIGRLVEEKANVYVASIQDDYEVSKKDAHVEVWKAADGKGVVYLKDFGKQKVYSSPDSNSKVVGKIEYEDGYLPDTYPCLGLENGWFKIRLDDKTGYIKASLMNWDAINTF